MSTTPIPVPTIDQAVTLISQSGTSYAAVVVHIWPDGPVDVVVTDPAVPEEFKVSRTVYVPFGGTFVPLNSNDTRHVTQLTTS